MLATRRVINISTIFPFMIKLLLAELSIHQAGCRFLFQNDKSVRPQTIKRAEHIKCGCKYQKRTSHKEKIIKELFCTIYIWHFIFQYKMYSVQQFTRNSYNCLILFHSFAKMNIGHMKDRINPGCNPSAFYNG